MPAEVAPYIRKLLTVANKTKTPQGSFVLSASECQCTLNMANEVPGDSPVTAEESIKDECYNGPWPTY